jgi:hypothetical protein
MARIRTIKPDFWTDEKLTECSLSARLLFIGTWNFADDNGNLEASAKQIKMKVFPADNIDCQPLVDELITHGMLIEYSVNDKKYLHIKGFKKHQVINRPSNSNIPQPLLTEELLPLTECSVTEGKGREGKGREDTYSPQQAGDVVDISQCPHQEIISLYAKHLPMGIQPKVWNEARQSALRARWREDVKRQKLEWWDRFFVHVAKSDFLTGKVSNREGRAFEVSLDWIVTASNFAKIIEGKYDNKAVA